MYKNVYIGLFLIRTMAQNQVMDFDIHNPNAILQRIVVIRQSLRAIDDELTGMLTMAVTQLQKEQREVEEKARAKAAEESKKKADKPSS